MLLSTLATFLLPFATASPGVWYTVGSVPSGGFQEVSATFKVDPASTRITGYYAATQWSFQGHDVQYFGFQPRSAGSPYNGHLTYSVFGPGSTVANSARCSGGADGGSGVSCSYQMNIDYNREYKIVSKVVETKTDGSLRWEGTLFDDSGASLATLGSWWTDKSYGGLKGSVAQWLEWYKFNSMGGTAPANRTCVPYFKTSYGAPTGYSKGWFGSTRTSVGYKTGDIKTQILDKCAVAANTPNEKVTYTSGAMPLTIEAGFLPQPQV